MKKFAIYILSFSPVHEMLSTPGSKCSMMDMVPPFPVENAGQLKDHVLRAVPAAELSGQPYPDNLGALELPLDGGHHVHKVSAAHSDADRRRCYRSTGVVFEITVLAKLLVQDIEDLLMLLLPDEPPVLHKSDYIRFSLSM